MKEALKLALEALETLMIERGSIYDKAITAIKAALAQPEQMHIEKNMTLACPSYLHDYTSPPQRTWVSLTDEQILHFVDTHVGAPSMAYPLDNSDWINFARAIEAAHGITGEKNGTR